ncbi:MAG: formyltransferase family protein [Blastocatellia bacterium]
MAWPRLFEIMLDNTLSNTKQTNGERRLKVVALLLGDPQAMELWTLKNLAAAPCELHVVRALKASGLSTTERLKRLARQHGVVGLVSRMLGSKFIAPRQERKELRQLDLLFDGEELRGWRLASGIKPIDVTHLNHADARSAIANLQPDIIVRVSGGVLGRGTFSLARVATLNIHHGVAPRIRGMCSIQWGIIEGRSDWIGATVHKIDEGIDTGLVLWRGEPQLAPGDTGTTLLFRAHLEAVEQLVRVIREYAAGKIPEGWPCEDRGQSDYRSAVGVGGWLRYLYLGAGKRAPVIFERAWRTKDENTELNWNRLDGDRVQVRSS